MSFSRLFFYSCLAFLIGVFVSSFLDFLSSDRGLFSFFFVLILALAVAVVFYKKETAVIGIFLLVFLFGIFWEEKFEGEVFPKCKISNGSEVCDIHYFNNKDEVVFEGLILEEPGKGTRNSKIILESQKIEEIDSNNSNNSNKIVRGKVLITLPLGAEFNYGDKLKVKGKLKTPESFAEDFNWSEYLRKDRIYSTIYNPEIEQISSDNGNKVFLEIFSLKEKLKRTADFLSPPSGALMSAIVLGDRSRFSKEVNDAFSRSGLVHINAISGMNIMILFEIFISFLIWLGFYRRSATIITLLFLIFYILLIGAPSSAVRAGIMGGFLYFGWALGRLNQSSRAIVFAASGMVIFNPLILARDVGFQLSFLASLGIIYLLPVFKRWAKADDSKFKELILLTFAAQIFCLPLLIFNFGQISILSPVSNLLVVPLLPVLTIIGFLYLILGTVFPLFAVPLSFVLWPLFFYVAKVAEIISSIPFSAIKFNIHWSLVLILYLIIIYSILKFSNRHKEICKEKV